MDAISFVLGIKSSQLRSKQLKDLVYRGRKLASTDDSLNTTQDSDDDTQGEGTAKTAWVMAVYEDETGKEWTFQRT
jgi:structural maintenance of chromosome 1